MKIEITQNINIDEIASFFGDSFPVYNARQYYNSRIQEELVFKALVNGEEAGYIIYTIIWGNTPYLEHVEVKDSMRGKGIAQTLVKRVLNDIKTREIPYQYLLSSAEVTNNVSDEFHKKFGFKTLNTLDMLHSEEQFYQIDIKDIDLDNEIDKER